MANEATYSGASDDHSIDDAANAFLKLWDDDAEKPSDPKKKRETPEDSTEDDAETDEADESLAPDEDTDESDDDRSEDDSDDDADEEADEKPKKRYLEDTEEETYVKLKVDGQEVEASVKDLKRLYGQEASLTRKSQELAATRKTVEDTGAKYVAGLSKLMEQAERDFEPYANLDFLALAKDPDISAEELTALRNEAETRFNRVNFLKSELDATVQQAEANRYNLLRQQAVECVKVLEDPEKGIKGWNSQLYDELRTFAIDQGLDKQVVNELVDPAAIKLLHAAMMYHKGQKALTDNKITKVNKTPKKIIKTTSSEVSKAATKGPSGAMQKLRKSGSQDDAAAAFLERWSDD